MLASRSLDDILEQYDSELFRVYKEINGEKCVKKISRDLSKDLVKVKMCLKNLYFHNVIKFVDIFRLSNHYQVTAKVHNFMSDVQLQADCAKYVAVAADKLIDVKEVVYLYLQASKSKAIVDVVMENKKMFERVNVVSFV